MISLFINNSEESNNIGAILDSIRDNMPKEQINICDNNSKSLLYIPELQNTHFKKYKYANNKTSIIFSVSNISDMVIKTIKLFPEQKSYWYIANTNWSMVKTLADINDSQNQDVLTLHSNDIEERFEIFKIPQVIVNSIKLMLETLKDERDINSILANMVHDDTFLLNFIKNNKVSIVSIFGNYYNETNIKNEYFELIKNENNR